jgi:VWFA-related protein
MKAVGFTAMRDAVRVSIEHLKKAHHEKKVLVIVTDGEDNHSAISLADLVKMAQQSDIVIYTVGILGGGDRRAQAELKALADATGGEAFLVKQTSQVAAVTQYIARDIRTQYTLEYSPSNAAMDGGYREIKIGVATQGRPQIRTRPGYYAMPDSR